MIRYEEAIQIIQNLQFHYSLKTEKVELLQAYGRILADEIVSPENIPYADNSAMDGYAINAQETILASNETPLFFNIESVVAAGDVRAHRNNDPLKADSSASGSCVEIMTGALLPHSHYDSVIKVEDVHRIGNQIRLTEPVIKGRHVRPQGTDFRIGKNVISKNTILKDQHIMALAALGISEVEVKKKMRVAVLSTGNEIVPFEQKNIKESQVRNSSAPFLKVFLERNHCAVTLFGIQNDEAQSFFELMQELLNTEFDLILTTGAVSMGKWDFILKTLPDLKMKILFHKVAIRPGKPILVAQSEDLEKIFFGLPGNPISTAVGARFFVMPFIERILQIEQQEKWIPLQSDVIKPDGLECFYKASLINDANPVIQALAGQDSYMIHSFLQSNCWVQLPASGNLIKAGTKVRVIDL